MRRVYEWSVRDQVFYLVAVREKDKEKKFGHSRIELMVNDPETNFPTPLKTFTCVHAVAEIQVDEEGNMGKMTQFESTEKEEFKELFDEEVYFFATCSFCEAIAEFDIKNFNVENELSSGLIGQVFHEVERYFRECEIKNIENEGDFERWIAEFEIAKKENMLPNLGYKLVNNIHLSFKKHSKYRKSKRMNQLYQKLTEKEYREYFPSSYAAKRGSIQKEMNRIETEAFREYEMSFYNKQLQKRHPEAKITFNFKYEDLSIYERYKINDLVEEDIQRARRMRNHDIPDSFRIGTDFVKVMFHEKHASKFSDNKNSQEYRDIREFLRPHGYPKGRRHESVKSIPYMRYIMQNERTGFYFGNFCISDSIVFDIRELNELKPYKIPKFDELRHSVSLNRYRRNRR